MIGPDRRRRRDAPGDDRARQGTCNARQHGSGKRSAGSILSRAAVNTLVLVLATVVMGTVARQPDTGTIAFAVLITAGIALLASGVILVSRRRWIARQHHRKSSRIAQAGKGASARAAIAEKQRLIGARDDIGAAEKLHAILELQSQSREQIPKDQREYGKYQTSKSRP
nr:LPXTG cell wall anchor domain-containing protein [Candidatus Sigynarchaeota archaeon]